MVDFAPRALPYATALGLAAMLASIARATSAVCPALPPPVGTIVSVATEPELQAAIASLGSNSTVLLADGVYDLTQTLVIGGVTGVAIRGASGNRDAVVLRGRGMSNTNYGNVPHGFLIQDATDLVIADLTVRDTYYHNVQIQGERGARAIQLYRLRLVDSGEQQVKGSTAGPPGPYADDGIVECSILEYSDRARSDYTNGVDVLAGANWTIKDNLFRNIRAPIGMLAGPAVLMWRNSLDTVVERNLFVDCDRAVALGLSAPNANSRDGETTYDHQGGIVRNNMIVRASSSPTGDVGITVNYARNYRILHNTVALSGTFPWTIEYRFSASNGEIAYNLSDGPILARDGASGTLTGNIVTAQPGWFVNLALGDLHLDPTATQAIDRAAPRADLSDDFDGDLRFSGAAPEVGADELGSCLVPAMPVRLLKAVRAASDVALRWTPSTSGSGNNVWTVKQKDLIDLARQSSAPPAIGVVGCSDPSPSPAPACVDVGGTTRDSPSPLFYQVRAACGGSREGP